MCRNYRPTQLQREVLGVKPLADLGRKPATYRDYVVPIVRAELSPLSNVN